MTAKLKLLVYFLAFNIIIFWGIPVFADSDRLILKRSKILKDLKSSEGVPPLEQKVKRVMHTTLDSIPYSSPVNYLTERYPVALFCADLDGDLDLDIAVATWPYQSPENISVLKNLGDGTFSSPTNYASGGLPYSVFCADLDGDLDLDIATANVWSDDVSVLKNKGDGTFQNPINYPAGEGPYSVFCADLDNDLDLDLAVANLYSNNVSILKNNGDAKTMGTHLFNPKLTTKQELYPPRFSVRT